MEEEKMDENEWGYHGEGNKSLVVAHAQVSGERVVRFRPSPDGLGPRGLPVVPSTSPVWACLLLEPVTHSPFS